MLLSASRIACRATRILVTVMPQLTLSGASHTLTLGKQAAAESSSGQRRSMTRSPAKPKGQSAVLKN
jgi:hypothetical protein